MKKILAVFTVFFFVIGIFIYIKSLKVSFDNKNVSITIDSNEDCEDICYED